jgi:hypothetical protein
MTMDDTQMNVVIADKLTKKKIVSFENQPPKKHCQLLQTV